MSKYAVIQLPDDAEPEDCADTVKYVASQMDEGFTSGRIGYTELNWSIEEDDGVPSDLLTQAGGVK